MPQSASRVHGLPEGSPTPCMGGRVSSGDGSEQPDPPTDSSPRPAPRYTPDAPCTHREHKEGGASVDADLGGGGGGGRGIVGIGRCWCTQHLIRRLNLFLHQSLH